MCDDKRNVTQEGHERKHKTFLWWGETIVKIQITTMSNLKYPVYHISSRLSLYYHKGHANIFIPVSLHQPIGLQTQSECILFSLLQYCGKCWYFSCFYLNWSNTFSLVLVPPLWAKKELTKYSVIFVDY